VPEPITKRVIFSKIASYVRRNSLPPNWRLCREVGQIINSPSGLAAVTSFDTGTLAFYRSCTTVIDLH
jgi:hypothetical protein